ncbi:MAG TPA: GNAT family N-acetyltransferase [Clostridiales bacterium]|nr:GNAT family N-acetyltransferase [Clostridiales bacterium]
MSYESIFTTLPTIETSRLILRQITNSSSDGRESLKFINDYSVYRYWGLYDEANDVDGSNKPKKILKLDFHYESTMNEYKAGNELTWLMVLKSNNKVIGEIVLYDFRLKKQADIGYRINKDYWGQGFATEAGMAMKKVAFEYMDLARLQIRCFADNLGSVGVARKLGFREEGLIRKGVIINVITDYHIFGFLNDDYDKNPIPDELVTIRL